MANFVLRDPTTTGTTAVYLIYNFDGKRLKYSTGITIVPSLWDATTQRARSGKKYPAEHVDLNQRLDTIDSAVGACYYQLVNEGVVVTTANLKTALEQKIGVRAAKTNSLADFADLFCAEVAGSRAHNTILAYRTTIKHLRGFEKKKRRQFDFADITLNWYHDFIDYLTENKLSSNSVGKHIKTIKTFMSQADERELHTSKDYLSKRFTVYKEQADSIYLTVADLEHLASLELPKLSLRHVRDTFILGSFTGLRFGDLTKTNTAQVVELAGGKVLKIKTQKTGKTVTIPLHPLAEAVLTEYNGMPPQYTNAGTNRLLKDLAQLAGWYEPVEVTETRGKLQIRTTRPRWELVTMHTSRRSFATNAYKSGVPLHSLMQLTGHTKITTLQTYLRISSEENAETLLQHSFFQSAPIMKVG